MTGTPHPDLVVAFTRAGEITEWHDDRTGRDYRWDPTRGLWRRVTETADSAPGPGDKEDK